MKRKIFFSLLVLALMVVASISAWQVYVPLQEDAESVRAYDNLTAYIHLPNISLPSEPPTESQIESLTQGEPVERPEPALPQVDFDALRAINPNVVGWLVIDGTNINYPVVQGTDNPYYLRHLFTGLMDYKEQGFYDAHPTALLLTPTGDYEIESISGYVTNIRADAWQVEFGSEEGFAEWLKSVKAKVFFQSEVMTSSSNKVFTLSTCSYEFENARFVLHGVLTRLP